MAQRVQKKKVTSKKVEEEVVEIPEETDSAQAMKEGLDDMLDDIDEVLEQNAEEFVKAYIQKGGE